MRPDLMSFIERSNQEFGVSRTRPAIRFTDRNEELLEKAIAANEEEEGECFGRPSQQVYSSAAF
jgi:hypothetical protein